MESRTRPPSILVPLAIFFTSYHFLGPISQDFSRPERAHDARLLSSIAVAALSSLVYLFYIYPLFISPLRHIPTAQADWRTRVCRWIYTEPTPDEVFQWIKRIPNKGLVRYCGLMGLERVVPCTAEAIKEMSVKNAGDYERAPILRERISTLFGAGLFALVGADHRTQKKKLLPGFAPRNIRELYPIFKSKACELIQRLEQHLQLEAAERPPVVQTEVELVHWTSRAALDIIGVAVWGKDFDALANPHSTFVTEYHKITRGTPRGNRQAQLVYTASLLIPMQILMKLFPCEFVKNLIAGNKVVYQRCKEAVLENREEKQTANSE